MGSGGRESTVKLLKKKKKKSWAQETIKTERAAGIVELWKEMSAQKRGVSRNRRKYGVYLYRPPLLIFLFHSNLLIH
jgi:hypothetical protein